MIADPAVFDDEHLPRRLLHREAAVDHLSRAWEPALGGDQAHDVLIHGPPGVGKTALTRHCLKKLTGHAAVQTAHVRCLGKTSAGVVRSVLHDLPGSDPSVNVPREDLCIQLQERVTSPVIVVLDEADGLPSTDALDRLIDVDKLSVVVICHDPDEWLSRLGGRLRRRLSFAEFGLDRYSVDELADILEARANLGLPSESVTRGQLETIADEVAGVARNGIQALRQAALRAEELQHDRITGEDVSESFERAKRHIRELNLDSLPFHHQLLYELIRMGDGLEAGELHNQYEDVANEAYHGHEQTPISERARRMKLSKLESYELIEVEGENRHRTYKVCDRRIESTVLTRLLKPPEKCN
ncbi:Cdc6/Cdc18 family protein [Haloarcula sp. KBTZ06]|uniref:Cdc6/Cdc18 family protein n=1 Tax=Haloarcula sp. KBTZ06 TaxID=3402682 RepID=UPI003B42D07E